MTLASPLVKGPRSLVCAEFVAFALLCGLVGALALRLDATGTVRIGRAFTMMSFGAAVAAAILLGLGAWLTSNGRAVRITLAVAVYSTVFLSTTLVDADSGAAAAGSVAGHVSLAAVLAFLALALRRSDVRPRARHAVATVAGLVAVAAVTTTFARADVLGEPLPNVVGAVIDAAAAAVALALLLSGITGDRPLLRRVGCAFLAITAGRLVALVGGDAAGQPLVASVSELVGVLVLLIAAVPFAAGAVSALWSQHEEWQSQLAEAGAAAEAAARRDHEMRNLVLGLTGATTAIGARIDSPSGRHLHAAASAELQRLRLMLDDRPTIPAAGHAVPSASAAAVLRDLAAVHRAGGAEVVVRAEDPLCAVVDPQALAQVITNLLVNCARHAPGARVELRGHRHGELVRIEVADSGPGLPPGVDPGDLLRSGVRGPASTGQGLGLHISAELVRRHGGRMHVEPTRPGPGCTVVVELVAARSRLAEPVGT